MSALRKDGILGSRVALVRCSLPERAARGVSPMSLADLSLW